MSLKYREFQWREKQRPEGQNLFWLEVKEAMEDNLESLILPESV